MHAPSRRGNQPSHMSSASASSSSTSSSSHSTTSHERVRVRVAGYKRGTSEKENEVPAVSDHDDSNEGQKRLRIITGAFEFGEGKGFFDNSEGCERAVSAAICSYYDTLGRDTSSKGIADMDAKILLMRFPGLQSAKVEEREEELFHPLFKKLSASTNLCNREIAGALSTIMVQLEHNRTYNGLIYDAIRRLEIGMRAAPSPRGLLTPPDVPSAGVSKPECSNMQLEQLQVYVKEAVVRYFCRDVVGVRRKCAPSCFSLTELPISITEALKGLSDGASKVYDHVTSKYKPPNKFGESWTLYFMSTYTETKSKLVSKMRTEIPRKYSAEVFECVQSAHGTFDPTNIWLQTASQVLFVVSGFMNSSVACTYRTREDIRQLQVEMKVQLIDVHLVCAYMVLGSVVNHKGLYADVEDFTSSDPFLGYCYWFLMKEVFLKAAIENVNDIPGFEMSSSTVGSVPGAEMMSRYEQHISLYSDQAQSKIDKMVGKVPIEKRDLFDYYFKECTPAIEASPEDERDIYEA